MIVIRVPNRRPITKITTSKGIQEILKPYYGNKDKGQYFIGAAFGPGWNDIVLDLHNKLVKEHPDYFIAQVKEKFATLRYYVGPMTDSGWEHVREAEELSAVTCEECGRPGVLRNDLSWILTLCDYDYKIYQINKKLWRWQSRPLHIYWKVRFAINRWRKEKGYIK
jgi:hypothetical protein